MRLADPPKGLRLKRDLQTHLKGCGMSMETFLPSTLAFKPQLQPSSDLKPENLKGNSDGT